MSKTFLRSSQNTEIDKVITTELHPSSCFLLLDSKDRQAGEKITNCNIKKAGSYFRLKGINKLALNYVTFPWWIPNVNPRNYTIIVKDELGNEHFGKLPVGYLSLEDYVSALQTELNTILGGFTVTILPENSAKRIRITRALPFEPIQDFTKNRDAWALGGIVTGNGPTTDIIGIAQLYYTRYIDIVSHKLHGKQPQLHDEASNIGAGDVITRLHGNDSTDEYYGSSSTANSTGGAITRPHWVQFGVTNTPKWVKWIDSEMLGNTIDIKLIDEFGDEVFIEDSYIYPNFTLEFICQSLE